MRQNENRPRYVYRPPRGGGEATLGEGRGSKCTVGADDFRTSSAFQPAGLRCWRWLAALYDEPGTLLAACQSWPERQCHAASNANSR